ncbi:MAG: hypothetical protein ACW991_03895, partial [Candidatus Hodarchaeales archaeon]
ITPRVLSYQDDFTFHRDPQGVYVSGDYAFVTDAQMKLWLIDISNPTKPGKPIRRDTSDDALNVYVSGDYAYVACESSGLAIVEVKRATRSVVKSTSIHTGEEFVQNVIMTVNQTIFPNTSITYQISSDGTTWISLTLNESYSFVTNAFHGLYWRAELTTNDTLLSPRIESVRIDFDVYYDEEPPVISLVQGQNNTVVSPGTILEFSFSDYLLDQGWFAWDAGDNQTLSSPWTIVSPDLEGDHWLVIGGNDSVGNYAVKRYQFYVNHPPRLELQSPLNNSVILPATDITFLITDPVLTNVWFQWDTRENTSLTVPFVIQAINSSGYHVLTIGAVDYYKNRTLSTYSFYIFGSTAIDFSQPVTAYDKQSFFYSFIITNPETIPLSLLLLVNGTEDDVLGGNNSQILLLPGDNKTVVLEIRPKHTSIHQLEIYLFFDGLVYYQETLKFNVAPQWMSPTFLLPTLLVIICLLFIVLVSGISLFYIRDQYLLRKLFWEQQARLTQLIDQLTIATLEGRSEKKVNDLEGSSTRPLGFPQHLQLSEPLDREAILHQIYSLKEQTINGDPTNLYKFSDLLIQVEKLLNEPQEKE